jgi:5'-nucleotidase
MAEGALILVTNDDGVYAPGLKALAAELQKIGRVVVVAPDRDNSAASHSLTMQRPLRVKELEVDWYSVDGTPTDWGELGGRYLLSQQIKLCFPIIILEEIANATSGQIKKYTGGV